MLFLSSGTFLCIIALLTSSVSGLSVEDASAERTGTAEHEFIRFAKRSEHTKSDILVKRGRAPSSHKLKLRIALRQEDPSLLEQTALDIATPDHARYRKHLTVDEAAHLSRPVAEAVEGVQGWLSDFGLAGKLEHDFIVVDATVDEAEALLNTTYHHYEHLSTREILVRTEEYSVPRSLHSYIDFVTPTTYAGLRKNRQPSVVKRRSFPNSHSDSNSKSNQPLHHRQTSTTPCGDGTTITPACIRYLYNITHNATSPSTTYAIYGTQGATYNQTDLSTFLSLYAPELAPLHPTFEQIALNGNSLTGGFDQDEPQLDTQWSLSLAYPAHGILYINGNDGLDNFTGDAASDDHYLAFLHDLVFNASVPSVISTSEEDNEGNLPAAYMQRVCNRIAAAGARGVSMIFSSGDGGIQGTAAPWAVYDLDASFPSSCPFATSVGGTVLQVSPSPNNSITETGLTLYTSFFISSGGGFSTVFPRPAYQDPSVSSYVQNHIDPRYSMLTGYAGPSGRGFPDISAVGANLAAVVEDGIVETTYGTSISAPIIAALITILNDVEASKGRPSLGYVNPWLYANAQAEKGIVRDIVTGGANVRPPVPGFPPGYVPYEGGLAPLGFNVSEGWDAVTGLGSVDLGAWVEALEMESEG